MKNIFKFKPKIVKGHSFNEYISKYSNDYVNCKLDEITDPKKLKYNKTYWKIDNKYYQINHKNILKKIFIVIGSLGIATSIVLPVTYHFINKEKYIEYNFKYWNECDSLNILKNYVKEVVNPDNKTYIPKEDRIVTFDMDGTLFGERGPIYIEWLMFHDYFLKHQEMGSIEVQYGSDKKTVKDVDDMIYKFMLDHDMDIKSLDLENWEAYGGAKLFNLLSIDKYNEYVNDFLDNNDSPNFNNLKYKDMMYKPMIEIVEFLQVNNFDVYIVSGTDRFMVRDIASKHLTIPSNRVIGMDVRLTVDDDGIVRRSDQLMYKCVENVKVELMTQEIGKKSVLSFGNSSGDIPMHEYCLSNPNYKNAAFMVNNDDNEREYANPRDWSNTPYHVFSMKNDFKTIYGDNVTKKA